MTARCHIEKTKRLMTARAGLLSLAQVMTHLEFDELVKGVFPKEGNRAHLHSLYVKSFVLMLNAGFDCLNDIMFLQKDKALRKVLGVKKFPNPRSMGKWLHRMGKDRAAWEGMEKIYRYVVEAGMEGHEKVTLDIDATAVESYHSDAKWMFTKRKGYMPMIATIAETNHILHMELREGNVPPAKNKLPFIQDSFRKVPAGVKVGEVRIDAAGFQERLIRLFDGDGIGFTIRAKMSRRIHNWILGAHGTSCWKRLKRPGGGFYRDREVCRTVYKIGKYDREFTLVIERMPKEKWSQRQLNLDFDDAIELEVGDYMYRAIITTRSELSDSEVVHHYNQRAEKIENRIRDLKQDFGGGAVPCGDFDAGSLFHVMTGLAYNLFVQLRSKLPKRFRRRRAATIRKWLYETVAMVTRSGRRLRVKVRQKKRRALLRRVQRLVQAVDPPPLPT